MSERRIQTFSIRGPLILFIIVLFLIVTLTVLWNVILVTDYQTLKELAAHQSGAFHWTFISIGSTLFVAIIVLASIIGAQLFSQIRWRQRQSNFLASVSHELNSPLSSIKLFAQTLRNDDLSKEDHANFIGKILFDVERLSRLIGNILRTAEADFRDGDLEVIPQTMNLYTFVEDYIAGRAPIDSDELEEISLSGDSEVFVSLDPMIFRQVLDNLVDNAIRYRGAHPARVLLRVETTDGWGQLDVNDQGIGIPSENVRHLFDRFYRVEGSGKNQPQKGTGIGLFVVRSIVRSHGGKVEAYSAGLGQGTRMTIQLPLVEMMETIP